MAAEQVPPVGSTTYHQANFVVRKAMVDGTDPIEALNRAGLLVTPARARAMEVAGLKAFRDEMFTWSVTQMLRKKNRTLASATPEDMYWAMVAYLTEFIDHVMEKGIEG